MLLFVAFFVSVTQTVASHLSTLHLCDPLNRPIKTDLKIGIIGAGISGLYAALLLQTLGIEYKIFEKNDRVGGRYFTHRFSRFNSNSYCGRQDYFDVGAMRFPIGDLYVRMTGDEDWSLFKFINKNVDKEHKLHFTYFIDNNKNGIGYFNGRLVREEVINEGGDVFHLGQKYDGLIPDQTATEPPLLLMDQLLSPFISALRTNFTSGMDYLQKYDLYSFRDYATNIESPSPIPSAMVDILEMMIASSGYLRYGLTEVVRDSFVTTSKFYNVEGGTSKIIEAMTSLMQTKPRVKEEVIGIMCNDSKVSLRTSRGTTAFDHVIVTPTPLAIANIDLQSCNISQGKRRALQVVHYVNALKVGLLFAKRWWQDSKFMNGYPIFGGSVKTDLPISRVVFPSTGLNCTNSKGVALVYMYANYANKMQAMSDEQIEKLCLKNLVEIFGNRIVNYYHGRYYVHRWAQDQHTYGAFPLFDAGHFNTYFKHLNSPEANRKLFFAGDAPGVLHGWSIDTLTTAYKSVEGILTARNDTERHTLLRKLWGGPTPTGQWNVA